MKLMVIGGGGREHAIIKKLKENPQVSEIFALPGNGGIAADATCVPIGAKDIEGAVAFAKENAIDFAVVAPDDPLVLGMTDALMEIGIPVFGPQKNAAIIEGSKVFSKNLMKKYNIPTATYEVFEDAAAALEYVKDCPIPTVIKADGLALGKGVIIAMTREEAEDAIRSIMEDKVFGASGSRIVIEEFLTGPEAIISERARPASTSPPIVFKIMRSPSISSLSSMATSSGMRCSYFVAFCPSGKI